GNRVDIDGRYRCVMAGDLHRIGDRGVAAVKKRDVTARTADLHRNKVLMSAGSRIVSQPTNAGGWSRKDHRDRVTTQGFHGHRAAVALHDEKAVGQAEP